MSPSDAAALAATLRQRDHAFNILSIITKWTPRKWWRAACCHEVYYEDMVRISDELVVAACHKCHALLHADCGLNMNARLMGGRPKKCEACNGSGTKP